MRGLLQYLKPTLPPVAVLMEPGAVFALRVGSAQRDPTPLVRHEESFESPDGHYLPGPEAMEVLSASLMTQLGSPKRISCIIGDPLFKTQVLTLSDFPRSEQERRKVILWHIRKFLNYPIDSVRMDYAIIGRVPGSVKLLVTLCPAAEIQALEAAFAAGGCQVGYVGSSTIELFNLALAKGALPPGGNALIINRTPDYLSFLFAGKGLPLFFRCKDLDGARADDEQVGERLLQELRLTLAYYREKLGGEHLEKVLIRRFPGGAFLPLEDIIEEDVVVQDLSDALPPLPSGASRDAEYLPIFGLLEGGA
jgi:hypothetical protein